MSKIIPILGSVGKFILKAPFDALLVSEERYTCMSIRKISECLANNIDVAVDFYTLPTSNGQVDPSYQDDLAADVEIIGLQNRKGHWVYVPSTAIIAYPDPNGINYHALSFVVTTKALPIGLDLSTVKGELENAILDCLGVQSSVKVVEASKPAQIDSVVHNTLTAQRVANMASHNNDRSRVRNLQQQLSAMSNKISALEAYIKANHL